MDSLYEWEYQSLESLYEWDGSISQWTRYMNGMGVSVNGLAI